MTLRTLLLTGLLILPLTVATEANAKKCKISVVGGSWKGHSFPLKMKDGKFVGTSGISDSNLPGCQSKKYIYGRWYHICTGGKLIVYKYKNAEWKRLSDKSLKKYVQNCI